MARPLVIAIATGFMALFILRMEAGSDGGVSEAVERAGKQSPEWSRLPNPEGVALTVLRIDREPIGAVSVDPFSSPPPPQAPAIVSAPPPPAPTPPPVPFRYAGRITGFDGLSTTYLMKGNDLISVRPGDMLDEAYRVVAVNGGSVEIVYLPLSITTELHAPDGGG